MAAVMPAMPADRTAARRLNLPDGRGRKPRMVLAPRYVISSIDHKRVGEWMHHNSHGVKDRAVN
jgi:hypothetical protein